MEPSRTVYVDPHLNAPSSRSNGNSNDRVEPRRDERRGTAGSHSGRRDGDHHEAGAVSRDEHSRWPREAERGRRAVATVGTSPTEGLTLDPTTSPATVVLSPARASLLTTTTAPGGTHAERTQEAPFRERQLTSKYVGPESTPREPTLWLDGRGRFMGYHQPQQSAQPHWDLPAARGILEHQRNDAGGGWGGSGFDEQRARHPRDNGPTSAPNPFRATQALRPCIIR